MNISKVVLSLSLIGSFAFTGFAATSTSYHVITLPIGAGVDGTLFDVETQNLFSSNGDGTLTVIHEKDPDTFEVIQNVETESGARTMDIDTKTHRIWLATAKLTDAANASVQQNRHHKSIVPDSFTAIEVGDK